VVDISFEWASYTEQDFATC